jgi:hypothetical protein
MKKVFSHLFVFLANFYFLSFSLIIVMMLASALFGPLSLSVSLSAMILTFLACLIYQIRRHKYSWFSFGERVISNTSKFDINIQENKFRITRTPLLIVLMVTLVIFSNSGDGISEGKVYSFFQVLIYGLFARSIYFVFTEFPNRPSWIPIGLIVLVLGYFYFQITILPKSDLKTIGLYLYGGLSLLWVLLGFLYIRKIKN